MATPAAAQNFVKISKVIRLKLQGCVNRPFYHVVVQNVKFFPNFLFYLFLYLHSYSW